MSKEQCNHLWVSNSGGGGDPIFGRTPFSRSFAMHVKCSKCNTRTWFTKEQWEDLIFTGDTLENQGTLDIQTEVLNEVKQERERQDKKWGGKTHDDQHPTYEFVQLIEDYAGWARVMAGMDSPDKARRRLIQVAALAVAAVESIDRSDKNTMFSKSDAKKIKVFLDGRNGYQPTCKSSEKQATPPGEE